MASVNKKINDDVKLKKGQAKNKVNDREMEGNDETCWGDGSKTEGIGIGSDEGGADYPFRRKSALARTPPSRRSISLPEERTNSRPPSWEDEVFEKGDEEKRKREEDSPTEPTKRGKRLKGENTHSREKVATRKGERPSTPSTSKGEKIPETYVVVSDSEEAAQSEKRGECPWEEETRVLEESYKEITKLISDVNRIANTLAGLVVANVNTKVEIKRGIEDLGWSASRLEKKGTRMAHPIEEIRKMLKEKMAPVLVKNKNASVQTEKEPWQTRQEATTNQIRKAMEKDRDLAGFRRLEGIDWPADVYRATKVVQGNPVWGTSEGNVAIYTGRGDNLDKGVGRQFLRKFPEVADLIQGRNRESVHLITYEVKMDGAKSSRSVSIITADDEVIKEYEALEKWKAKLKEEGIHRVAVVSTDNDFRMRRKLLEHVFWGEEIKILIYEQEAKGGKKMAETVGREQIPPRRRPPISGKEAVIVSAVGKSYAELLRAVKGKVDAAAIGVEISAVRETRAGELLLTLEGGQEKTKALKSEIQARCREDGIKIRGGRRDDMVLNINGIDPTATKEDIEKEIRAAIGETGEPIDLKSLRSAFGGNNNVTIAVPRALGEKLAARGSIRVGWSLCKVLERIDVGRCFKCWGIGHKINDCKGPDRRSLCLKCGGGSHKAADCKETPKCPLCNVAGHRADSAACPIIREEIRRRRAENEPPTSQGRSRDMDTRERRDGEPASRGNKTVGGQQEIGTRTRTGLVVDSGGGTSNTGEPRGSPEPDSVSPQQND